MGRCLRDGGWRVIGWLTKASLANEYLLEIGEMVISAS